MGAVLGESALALRFPGGPAGRPLLIVNLGCDLHFAPMPEPLLAPPEGASWTVLWSSESPRYGGSGTAPPEAEDGWRIPGHAAVLLEPRRSAD